MRRGAATLLLVAAGALALLAVPAGASARPLSLLSWLPPKTPPQLRALIGARLNPDHSHRPFRPAFTLKGSNGYTIIGAGFGNYMVLEVRRRGVHAATDYVARGTVTPNRLVATFGTLGEVDLRFHRSPSHGAAGSHRSCHGRHRFVHRQGVYVGRIRFSGENGYVSVNAHRARGEVTTVAPRCARRARHRIKLAARPVPPGLLEIDTKILVADSRHGVSSETFLALEFDESPVFAALSERTEGRLGIFRFAVASAQAGGFSLDDALTLATVAPPAPFAGTATYKAAPDGTKTWEGPLTVDFPGVEGFPLTGPQFEVEVASGTSGIQGRATRAARRPRARARERRSSAAQ